MIIWTALPNGYSDEDGGFRLTVLVSPRLPSLALGEFTNWPERIRDLAFDVVFADTAGATPFTDVKPKNDLDPDLWQRVFRNTIVHDAEETRKEAFETKVRSYSTQAIAQPIRGMYALAMGFTQPNTSVTPIPPNANRILGQLHWFRSAGAGPFVHDAHDEPEPLPSSAGGLRDVYRLSAHPDVALLPDVIRRVKGIHGESGGLTFSSTASDFLSLALFHRRVQNQPFHQPPKNDCREFHRQIALLLNYPALLRPLGLALDLILPGSRTSFPSTTGRVSVRPNVTFAAGFEPCLPWTRFEPAGTVPFHPAADGDTCSGMLRLQGSSFDLESLDVDGAAMNLIGLADSHLRGLTSSAPGPRNSDSMPSLRTAGIAVISHGRQNKVEAAIDRAKDFENRCRNNMEIILAARDVTEGYVVDVHSILPGGAGEWRSLCDRDEKFITDGMEVAFSNRAGIVRPGASRAVDKLTTQKEPPNELYVHEALFRWTGWSLTVQRPRDIPRVGVRRSTSEGCDWIDTEFKAIRLPRLRFGGQYRFRARLADLAGNTLAPDETSENCSIPGPGSAPFVFRRYEPVPPPPILLVNGSSFHPRLGDQLNRLVIRDGRGRSTRCCVPPRTSRDAAEMHGMFDSRSPGARGSFQAVGLESNGEFFQEQESKNPIYLPPRGVRPDPPYYPDPLAHRGQLILLDDLAPAASIQPFSFYDGDLDDRWPLAGRFFVTVVPTGRRPQIDARWTLRDTLEIALPPGRQATLRVSSQFRDAQSANLMALVAEGGSTVAIDVVTTGSHEMITPGEEMHLVHAVKQPLETPVIRATLAERLPGSVTAKLDFQIDIDDKSTGRVEVVADWSETVDDPSQPGPEQRKGHAPLTEENRPAPAVLETTTVSLANIEQRFSDSKYRCIDYTGVATTRFAEYFQENDPRAFTKTSSPVHLAIPSSARPVPAVPLYVLPTFGWASSRSGRRFFSDRAGGGLRVYFARPWYSSGDGELVGIALAPEGFSGDSTGLTHWGIDPTFKAVKIPDFPKPEHFEGHVHVRTNVAVPLDAEAIPKTVTATLVGYQPVYDPARKLWYADVIVRNPGAYTPFIRLSIVRFQPVSLRGLEASMFVPAEFAQLFPSRRVSVTRGTTRDALCVYIGGDPIPPDDDPAKRFRIQVDRQCVDLAGNVTWLPIPTISGACAEAPSAGTLFAAQITVGNVCGPLRLRIEEFETRMGDAGEKKRLIYADVLEL